MPVIVKTSDPTALWAGIKAGIEDNKIQTWKLVIYNGKEYITHKTSSNQWDGKGYFSLGIFSATGEMKLIFHLGKGVALSDALYGVYHGRVIEMILSHFSPYITGISSTIK